MRLALWLLIGVAACSTGCGEPPVAAPPPAVASAADDLPAGFDDPVPPVAPGAPHLRLMLISGCVMCERIDSMTRDLEKKYGPALHTDRHNSESPAGREYLRSVGMRRHGVVMYDKAGKVVWRNDNHALESAQLASAVDAVTKGQVPPAEQGLSPFAQPDSCSADHGASPKPASPAR